MAGIEKIRDDLYIRKGWDGYRVVYPVKKDITKPMSLSNIHWRNLLGGGHWSWSLKCLLFLIALYFFVQMYLADTAQCREFVANIDQVCSQYYSTLLDVKSFKSTYSSINISSINLSLGT